MWLTHDLVNGHIRRHSLHIPLLFIVRWSETKIPTIAISMPLGILDFWLTVGERRRLTFAVWRCAWRHHTVPAISRRLAARSSRTRPLRDPYHGRHLLIGG